MGQQWFLGGESQGNVRSLPYYEFWENLLIKLSRALKAVVGAQPGDVTTLEDGVAVDEAMEVYEEVKAALEKGKTS